jgi:hypothetical protein
MMLKPLALMIVAMLTVTCAKHVDVDRTKTSLFGKPREVVTIRNNLGGQVDAFVNQRRIYERDRVSVHISGECTSACTIYTGLRNVCVEPDAFFRFHESDDITSTTVALNLMDPDIKKFILASPVPLPTFKSQEFLYLSGSEAVAKRMLRACT